MSDDFDDEIFEKWKGRLRKIFDALLSKVDTIQDIDDNEIIKKFCHKSWKISNELFVFFKYCKLL